MDEDPRNPEPLARLRYCARCGGEGRGESALCQECGEKLRFRGYCPICESFWKLDPGADCPKHEVELIEEAPQHESFGQPGEKTSLVTVATYSHPNLANAPRIRLEAEGIPTFLDGERIAGNTLYQVATGGVRLQVPSPLASAARILIDQSWAPPPDTEDDTEDAWEDLAPEPGARRRAIMKLAIFVFLFGPTVVALISLIQRWAANGP
ncbi:hypothetical protein P12x_003156 [Tundrisphaera lichenicola]|uniref:hypothetical protein n=1 Tax=Tundrisphaera lichenicola TaxID=2029860 RepID=UPI003EB791DE